jgi:DNA polymerase bacteriophage-type
VYTIDFETRSLFDLRRGGLHKYARHFSTDLLCCAFKKDDEATRAWIRSEKYNAALELFLDDIRRGETVEAHNAEFELQIWNNVAVKKYGWPALKSAQVQCSMARAGMAGLPRGLGLLAQALGTPIQKDKEGYALMMQMCKPDPRTGKFIESPEKLARLCAYCIVDVDTEHGCGKRLPHLPPVEQRLWALTAEMNQRGLGLDVDLCEIAIRLLTENDARLHKEVRRLTGGRCRTGRQVVKMKEELAAEGCDVENLNKVTVAAMLRDPGLSDNARELLQARAEISKASVRKYRTMMDYCGDDRRIRGTLRYHGANTGRWSGQGIQPQNFFRPTIKDTTPILNALRDAANQYREYDLDEVYDRFALAMEEIA